MCKTKIIHNKLNKKKRAVEVSTASKTATATSQSLVRAIACWPTNQKLHFFVPFFFLFKTRMVWHRPNKNAASKKHFKLLLLLMKKRFESTTFAVVFAEEKVHAIYYFINYRVSPKICALTIMNKLHGAAKFIANKLLTILKSLVTCTANK